MRSFYFFVDKWNTARQVRREPDNTGYRKDRSYQDFERYLEKFPDTNVVELDVVEGAGGKSEQVLLTMLFRNCSLMLIFLMEADRKDNVQDVFQRIYTHLGAELYRKLFPVILTDNGASFKDPAISCKATFESGCSSAYSLNACSVNILISYSLIMQQK